MNAKTVARALTRRVRQTAAWPTHLGRRYYCPVCGRHARRFLPHGNPPRPQARCPWCGSLERHRALWHYIETLPAPGSILHIAPEPEVARRLKATARTYVSLDLQRPADVNADLTKPLPFEDGAFDLIVCSHVLEHIPDDRAAIDQLARVLSPSGRLLVMVPQSDADHTIEDPTDDPAERRRLYGQHDHVRLYGQDILERLSASALDVERIAWRDLPPAEIKRTNLRGNVYVCSRKR